MKLFNAIAATAAVITCCLGNPLPAEASTSEKDFWELVGRQKNAEILAETEGVLSDSSIKDGAAQIGKSGHQLATER